MAKHVIPLTMECLRKSRNLTQLDLADAIGITQTEISMVESGKRKPSESTLRNLEKYFKCPGDVLFSNIQVTMANGNAEKHKLKIS